jgi:hypothetical protein
MITQTQPSPVETVDLEDIKEAVIKMLHEDFSTFYQVYFSGQVQVSERLN